MGSSAVEMGSRYPSQLEASFWKVINYGVLGQKRGYVCVLFEHLQWTNMMSMEDIYGHYW